MTLLKNYNYFIACECFFLTLVSFCFGTNYAIVQLGIGSTLTPMNCSEYCQCQLHDIQNAIIHFYEKHNSFSGSKYEEDLNSYSKYMDFLGIYTFMVGNIVEISCNINDGRDHTVSSLLNGIENLKYTSLDIKCRAGENIIWDVPSWQISFNIFESKKCNIVPEDESKGVVIPMNMWVFEVENIGSNLINQLDIRYTINTLVLSIEGTDTFTIPDKWAGDAMISADRISLQSNNLRRYECKIQFTKDLDTLNLNHNDLAKFPECLLLDSYLNIRFLSLSHNDISDIYCLFTDAPFGGIVEMLDLSFNAIEKIGRFKSMNKLSVLDLSNNQITQINDDAFNQLHDLKKLHLQNNRIQYIGPVAFRENINLDMLKLSNNLLKFVGVDQFPTTRDILIDLRKNKQRMPPFMNDMKRKDLPQNIQVLSVNNPFHCECDVIVFEEYVNMMDKGTRNLSKAKDFFLDLHELRCASPKPLKGKYIQDQIFTQSCIVNENCPPSCECKLLDKSVFVINCTANRLLEMPEYIPIYPDAKIILDLSHNPLQVLGHRSYLSNLSEFYMDNCLITSVSSLAISSLQNVKVLTLHNNLLQKLPSNMKNITLKRAINVTLHNNRWSCSCDSLWLPRWISAHRSVVWMPGTILCSYLKKPLEDFNSADVNCESYSDKDIVLAVSLILSSLLSTFLILFYYLKEIKLLLYSKLGLRLCADFSYGDQFSPFDAFVSYGQDNYKWVVDTLKPHLEDGPKKFKLCLHYRDFPEDESNVDNIPWAIRLSRCSILVLSKDFMRKEWCILELRAIFQRLLMAANKLIIIATDDVRPEDLTPDLCSYMNAHDYLKINEPLFWEKLEMFLPPKESPGDVLSFLTDDHDVGQEMMEESGPGQFLKAEGSFISVKNDSTYDCGDFADTRF